MLDQCCVCVDTTNTQIYSKRVQCYNVGVLSSESPGQTSPLYIWSKKTRWSAVHRLFTSLIIINQHLVNFCVNCKVMSKFDKCLDFLKFEENDLSMCCMFGFTRCARYFCAAITACTETAIRALIGKRESGRHLWTCCRCLDLFPPHSWFFEPIALN